MAPSGGGAGGEDSRPSTTPAALGAVELPAGSFGAGGWAPGGKGQYPRLSKKEAEEARNDFHGLLVRRHYSIIRAWKAFDVDGNGRLSFFEFMRGCQDLGVMHGVLKYGARQLWDALDLDRSGYISLEEIDMELAKLLMTLAATIWLHHGTLERAWKERFNKQNFSFRVPKEEFIMACRDMGFPGDAGDAFEAMRADLATVGISREEFEILGLWFAKEEVGPISPLHEKAELEQSARVKDTRDVAHTAPSNRFLRENAGKAKREFKALLIKTFGNFLRAWREGLDYDHNGVLDYSEFKRACQHIGYPGPRQPLWLELDGNKNGFVSLCELDEPTAKMVGNLHMLAENRYGSWEDAWVQIFDNRHDDRVQYHPFLDACRLCGYKGNPDKLFDMLDLDRVGYLSWSSVSWMTATVKAELGLEEAQAAQAAMAERAEAKEAQELDPFARFQVPTKSRARRVDIDDRDHRVTQKRHEGRARGEIPGSSTFAGSMEIRSGMGRRFSMSNPGSSGIMSPCSLSPPGSPTNRGSLNFGGTWSPGSSPGRSQRHSFGGSSTLPSFQKAPGSPKHVSRDPVGVRAAPGFSDYMKKEASGGKERFSKSAGSSCFSAASLVGRPLSPQGPGKGGWPLPPHKLTDPQWGGSGTRAPGVRPSTRTTARSLAAVVALPPAVAQDLPDDFDPAASSTPFARSAFSAPELHAGSLARWRQTVSSSAEAA